MNPTRIAHVHSSFFDDPDAFPPGSAIIDNALLMRRVPVRWQALPRLTATATITS